MDLAGDGEVVTRLRITINGTNNQLWFPLDSSISFPSGKYPDSGTTKIFLNEFTELEQASNIRYEWRIGDGDVDEGHLLATRNNGETNFETMFEFFSNFATADGATVTLEVQTIDSFGGYTTNSDCVKVIEAAAAAASC